MEHRELPRRTVLKGGAAGLAGLSVVAMSGPAAAFPGSHDQDVVIPWLDQPAPIPVPAQGIAGNLLVWEDLDSWHTPNDEFFTVKHYNLPALSAADHRVTVEGLVANPRTLSVADLRQLPRTSVDFTLECSGNHGLPFLIGAIGNARWGGTSLRRLLRQARPRADAVEVVFWGADAGQVTIKDNSGVTGGGLTGVVKEGTSELTITEQFARSMTLEDAMNPDNLLCYEMNGQPLPPEHGHPVRLIAPGWYGVANVKWLSRIEVTDRRYEGRFMARDYVTIRETKQAGKTVWTFTSVAQDRLKSAPAKVVRRGHHYSVLGAAWGAAVARVEVQVDGGPWRAARLQRHRARGGGAGFAWDFWSWHWPSPTPGEHTIASRAYDEQGNVQPTPTDDSITNRRTYWENNGQVQRRVRI
jgi:DMSO/TMAO reductase YedYZ molybdopterin-dependent catalytic subunit